jgi:hypothetical protein
MTGRAAILLTLLGSATVLLSTIAAEPGLTFYLERLRKRADWSVAAAAGRKSFCHPVGRGSTTRAPCNVPC